MPLGGSSYLYGQVPSQLVFKKDIRSFLNGENQKSFQKYVAENFPLRNNFVRIRNDIAYLLNLTLAPADKNYFIGKENWLFADDFLKHLFTSNKSKRDDFFRENLGEIKKFSEFFKRFDVPVIVVIGPDKALTYKDKLPFPYSKAVEQSKNFYVPIEKVISYLKQNGIPVINGHDIFLAQEDKSSLFTPGGIHWTQWGAALLLDSIEINIDDRSEGGSVRNLPKKHKVKIDKPLLEEDDIRLLQNSSFFRTAHSEKFPRVEFSQKYAEGTRNVWVYGDSFTYQLNSAIEQGGFAKKNSSRFIGNTLISKRDFYKIISQKSALIICYTLVNFAYDDRIARDLSQSLKNFKSNLCVEGCQGDPWTGAEARYEFITNSTSQLGVKLIDSMPSVTNIEINVNDMYVKNIPVCKESQKKGGYTRDEKQECLYAKGNEIEIPKEVVKDGFNFMEVKVSSPITPVSAGIGADRRKLGVILELTGQNFTIP